MKKPLILAVFLFSLGLWSASDLAFAESGESDAGKRSDEQRPEEPDECGSSPRNFYARPWLDDSQASAEEDEDENEYSPDEEDDDDSSDEDDPSVLAI